MVGKKPRVLVIGGGLSGLVCLRHLMPVADVTVLEARSSVGGLWASLQEGNPIDQAVAGNIFQQKYACEFKNIYDDLIMNTPTVFAHFKDFPQAERKQEFLTRDEFHNYLQGYVMQFDLMSKVRLNTFVVEVKRAQVKGSEDTMQFAVRVCNSMNQSQMEDLYADFVVVANGHNNVPYLPAWNGIETFSGHIMHSHDFRRSNDPAIIDKSVLVVGASFSGFDMLVQLLAHPARGVADIKKVYFSGSIGSLGSTSDFKEHIDTGKLQFIDSRIQEIAGSQVSFTNGEKVEVDLIIACTGYQFCFPFLKGEEDLISLSHDNMYFGPLFKRTFAINEPRLCFVGNVDRTCFIQQIMEYQAMVVASYIKGDLKLPGKKEMLLDLEQELQDWPGDQIHRFFKPFCVCAEDSNIINGFFDLLPSLKKDEDFIESLNSVGKKLVEFYSKGDVITVRKTPIKCHAPGFTWNSTRGELN